MQLDADIIGRCVRECADAPTGHGRRWEVARCESALVRSGTSPVAAMASAVAARNTGEWLRGAVQRLSADVAARLRP